jgi:hypothetical protein
MQQMQPSRSFDITGSSGWFALSTLRLSPGYENSPPNGELYLTPHSSLEAAGSLRSPAA